MCWDIALHTRVGVDLPGAADIIVGFKDDVLDEILQLGLCMLDLMSKDQTRESSANGGHSEFTFVECWMISYGDAYLLQAFCRDHDDDWSD